MIKLLDAEIEIAIVACSMIKFVKKKNRFDRKICINLNHKIASKYFIAILLFLEIFLI